MTVAPIRRVKEHAYAESIREAYRAEIIMYREVRNQMDNDVYVYQQ